MNKSSIKNFAIWARNKLIADISYRAGLLGITADGIGNALPQSTGSTEFYDIKTAEPYSISGDAVKQRRKLVEVIRQKEKDSDYQTAYKYIIEEVAYTWFNRLIAIRFMEVNDYLPSHVRVLSSETGKLEPDIVTNPFDAELDFTGEEEQIIMQLKNNNQLDELFRVLFIKQCNALNKYLPALFEKTKDYTELLLNLSVIDNEGLIYKLVHDIEEDDFNIEKGGQVEIIGWLYQYYNTEPKNAAFAKSGKISKEEIPAVTQLFTPDWIVRYMVENSVGRIWIEHLRAMDEGADEEKLAQEFGWKYYLAEAKQEPEVEEKLYELRKERLSLTPEQITMIDPCMGSGHILVYAFDVLMQIYESAGYGQRDAAGSILEYNLFGLDIDDRAAQMAHFAVMMKARQYNRRILNGENSCKVYAIQESNGITDAALEGMGKSLSEEERKFALTEIKELITEFQDAKEYGSILNIEKRDWYLLHRFAMPNVASGQIRMDIDGVEEAAQRLQELIAIAEVLAKKYMATVTNPPYMAISSASLKLNKYINENYIGGKTDLFSVFIERCLDITSKHGLLAMITMQSWMFLTSFEKIRERILACEIINMVHLGARGFDEISGEVVQTTSFVVEKLHCNSKYIGTYARLINGKSEYEKEHEFLSRRLVYKTKNSNFKKIPQSLIAYWISDKTVSCFEYPTLEDIFVTREGMATADNELFLRLWSEIDINKATFDCTDSKNSVDREIKWVPYNKGGSKRDWYGNNDYVVNWENDGYLIKNNRDSKTGRIRSHNYNGDYSFKEGATWSAISSGDLSVRYSPKGYLFDSKGAKGFSDNYHQLLWIIGLLNSKVAMQFLQFMSPTLDFKVGDIISLPYIENEDTFNKICYLVKGMIFLSKADWDMFETSWDFKIHPLVNQAFKRSFDSTKLATIKDGFQHWSDECYSRLNQLRENEEELNRIFIDIYGLQDELTPEVEEKDVTVRRADLQRDIKSLLSYAVGCMFGRYSLDVDGLAYAGGEWDSGKYKTFIPDADNVLPITDEEYLEDDIVVRFCEWLRVVYGEDTLEENLDFIAKALGNKGSTSRDIIRNYFLNDFFKDHCQTYSVTGSGKRPIYWLFDSGKQNGFKALVYLHRYTPDTIGNLRVDYLHRMQRIYESEINRMQDMIDHSTNSREVAAATKRKEKLQKQLKECREYDEKIGHLALSRIELDLDDGVKRNYRKVQTAVDGKFYEVLADSKNIMAKE